MKAVHLAGMAGIAVAAGAPEACAQVYAGAGYTQLSTEIGIVDRTYEFTAATARAGFQFNPFVAIEGEYSIGVEGGTGQTIGSPSGPAVYVPVELDSQWGAFAVGKLPIPVVGSLFARAGFARLEVDSTAIDFFDADTGGTAYGAGLEFGLFFLRGRAEYTKYDIDEGYESYSVSVLAKF